MKKHLSSPPFYCTPSTHHQCPVFRSTTAAFGSTDCHRVCFTFDYPVESVFNPQFVLQKFIPKALAALYFSPTLTPGILHPSNLLKKAVNPSFCIWEMALTTCSIVYSKTKNKAPQLPTITRQKDIPPYPLAMIPLILFVDTCSIPYPFHTLSYSCLPVLLTHWTCYRPLPAPP
jgi:hypothetical protein